MATEPTDRDRPDPRLAGLIAGLADRPPETDLWPGIARRIERRGTVKMTWPVALAAACLLIVASVSATLLWQRAAAPATVSRTPVASHLLPVGFDSATSALAEAIDQLEQTVAAATPRLDTAARRRIDQSLATLDAAIADARRAALATPEDVDAARYLTRTMQRKLSVLQTVATMMQRS